MVEQQTNYSLHLKIWFWWDRLSPSSSNVKLFCNDNDTRLTLFSSIEYQALDLDQTVTNAAHVIEIFDGQMASVLPESHSKFLFEFTSDLHLEDCVQNKAWLGKSCGLTPSETVECELQNPGRSGFAGEVKWAGYQSSVCIASYCIALYCIWQKAIWGEMSSLSIIGLTKSASCTVCTLNVLICQKNMMILKMQFKVKRCVKQPQKSKQADRQSWKCKVASFQWVDCDLLVSCKAQLWLIKSAPIIIRKWWRENRAVWQTKRPGSPLSPSTSTSCL